MTYQVQLVYVTFSDHTEAKKMIHDMISTKLIACGNIVPIESLYLWNGVIENDNELVVNMKTIPEKFTAVEQYILEKHSYETPCILTWPVQASKAYYEWINTSVK